MPQVGPAASPMRESLGASIRPPASRTFDPASAGSGGDPLPHPQSPTTERQAKRKRIAKVYTRFPSIADESGKMATA